MSKKQMIIGTVMEDEKYGEGDVGHIYYGDGIDIYWLDVGDKWEESGYRPQISHLGYWYH